MENLDPLVTTDWLAAHLEDENLRVVDIRGYVDKTDLGGGRQKAEYLAGREEYDEAHIPGDDTRVVIYDHAGGQFATRLWWALTYYGHDGVFVLDGGWKKWTVEDRPTTAEVPEPEPAVFSPEPQSGWRAGAEDLLATTEGGDALVLDARDEGQYTGAVTRGEARAGRIPGAAHLHADSLFDPQSGTFHSGEELARRLEEAGVPADRDEPVVAYCNGGVAATVPLFVLHRLGYKRLANYDGS